MDRHSALARLICGSAAAPSSSWRREHRAARRAHVISCEYSSSSTSCRVSQFARARSRARHNQVKRWPQRLIIYWLIGSKCSSVTRLPARQPVRFSNSPSLKLPTSFGISLKHDHVSRRARRNVETARDGAPRRFARLGVALLAIGCRARRAHASPRAAPRRLGNSFEASQRPSRAAAHRGTSTCELPTDQMFRFRTV